MSQAKEQLNTIGFDNIGWKSYHTIKKKAMEQEFSWSGLLISLSIAFFVVVACAQGLRFVYDSINASHTLAQEQSIDRISY